MTHVKAQYSKAIRHLVLEHFWSFFCAHQREECHFSAPNVNLRSFFKWIGHINFTGVGTPWKMHTKLPLSEKKKNTIFPLQPIYKTSQKRRKSIGRQMVLPKVLVLVVLIQSDNIGLKHAYCLPLRSAIRTYLAILKFKYISWRPKIVIFR